MHSVPGTVVDAQLGHALPHSFHISGISGSQALDPDLDARSCAEITQFVEPACERLGLAHFNHESVAVRLHFVNATPVAVDRVARASERAPWLEQA